MSTHHMSDLLVGADWACTNADLGTLAHNAEQLAYCVAEPLRSDLLDVIASCHRQPDVAMDRWWSIRDRLRTELRTTDPALHASA